MSAPLPEDRHGLIIHSAAAGLGRAEELRRRHRGGELRRISRGVYTANPPPSGPAAAVAAEEYRERVLAAGARMGHPVFTSFSAAALFGLPIVGRWPSDLYVLSTGEHGKRRDGVISVARRSPVEPATVAGLQATPVEFTLIQVARHGSLAQALVAADAALHQPRSADAAPPLTAPERVLAEYRRLLPFHGSRRVRAVLEQMTTLAETPLETLSRYVIEALGFAPPTLQQRFWLPDLGREAFVDFWWEEAEVIGEADGDGKYLDARSARGAARRVIGEKQREDELRAQCRKFVRWGWQDAWWPARLEQKLLRAGVPRLRPRRASLVGIQSA